MSYQATNDTLDSRIHASCAPLFATDLVLASGHSDESVNATVTFVKRSGRYYAVTCHHVLDAMCALALRIKHPLAPSLHTGRTVCHFGTWTPNGRYRWAFQSCRDFLSCKSDLGDEVLKKLQADLDNANADKPDIAIADISSIWLQLAVARSLEPVDLDDWSAPGWSRLDECWMAFGFPNEHKHVEDPHVVAKMPRIIARLETLPSTDRPYFVLYSTLEKPHGYYFSGTSGGPVVAYDATADWFHFVGLVYEGGPSSGSPQKNADGQLNSAPIFGERDIFLRCYWITPSIFDGWRDSLSYGVELPL